jgi:hypothetical protein
MQNPISDGKNDLSTVGLPAKRGLGPFIWQPNPALFPMLHRCGLIAVDMEALEQYERILANPHHPAHPATTDRAAQAIATNLAALRQHAVLSRHGERFAFMRLLKEGADINHMKRTPGTTAVQLLSIQNDDQDAFIRTVPIIAITLVYKNVRSGGRCEIPRRGQYGVSGAPYNVSPYGLERLVLADIKRPGAASEAAFMARALEKVVHAPGVPSYAYVSDTFTRKLTLQWEHVQSARPLVPNGELGLARAQDRPIYQAVRHPLSLTQAIALQHLATLSLKERFGFTLPRMRVALGIPGGTARAAIDTANYAIKANRCPHNFAYAELDRETQNLVNNTRHVLLLHHYNPHAHIGEGIPYCGPHAEAVLAAWQPPGRNAARSPLLDPLGTHALGAAAPSTPSLSSGVAVINAPLPTAQPSGRGRNTDVPTPVPPRDPDNAPPRDENDFDLETDEGYAAHLAALGPMGGLPPS